MNQAQQGLRAAGGYWTAQQGTGRRNKWRPDWSSSPSKPGLWSRNKALVGATNLVWEFPSRPAFFWKSVISPRTHHMNTQFSVHFLSHSRGFLVTLEDCDIFLPIFCVIQGQERYILSQTSSTIIVVEIVFWLTPTQLYQNNKSISASNWLSWVRQVEMGTLKVCTLKFNSMPSSLCPKGWLSWVSWLEYTCTLKVCTLKGWLRQLYAFICTLKV